MVNPLIRYQQLSAMHTRSILFYPQKKRSIIFSCNKFVSFGREGSPPEALESVAEASCIILRFEKC